MNPKEKACILIRRYYIDSDLLVEDLCWIQAKECALIAVDEILHNCVKSMINYWKKVKQEIQML